MTTPVTSSATAIRSNVAQFVLGKYMVAPNSAAPVPSYVAVLKAKQGELLAVQTTPPPHFIPLFEVIEPSRSAALARGWPHGDHVAWVQPINFAGADDQSWADATTDLFDELRTAGSTVVPVVTLDETASSYTAINAVIATDDRGLVLRLDCEEVLEEIPVDLQLAIDTVLADCGVTAAQTDLVLDAGLVSGGVAIQSGAAGSALGALPHIGQWRNLAVAFSGFPDLVSDHVSPSTVGTIPRVDAASFNHLTSRFASRTLTFADYGVGVPTYADAKWSPIPNIRYAVQGEWIIHRAATKLNPSPQYIKLAQDLAAAAYFSGPGFSPGDDYIADVASGADGPGNAGSYLKAAMSRHFHVVLDPRP
jgi:hypothetical protein